MISIIVPVYQAEHSLCFCVESILRQSYPDFETILVDDGSTDHSGKLCDYYAGVDKRIKVIHQKNGGVSSARNAGIGAVVGEYVVFCDSDDYIEADYLECLYNVAQTHRDYNNIWCRYRTVSSFDTSMREKETNYENHMEVDTEFYTLNEYMKLSEQVLTNQPWNKLYRTEVIKEARITFPDKLSLGEDLLFNLQYLDSSADDRILLITKPLYNYYVGREGLNKKYRPDLLEIYDTMSRELYRHLLKWNAGKEGLSKYYNSRYFGYENVMDNTMKAPDLSRKEKIRKNSSLLKSDEFRETLHRSTCYLNRSLKRAYESGNYRNVMLVKGLADVKHKYLKF